MRNNSITGRYECLPWRTNALVIFFVIKFIEIIQGETVILVVSNIEM